MKNLNTYIYEKLTIIHNQYSYVPETKKELKEIITERLNQDPDVDLNDIDVSNITDMSNLFSTLDPHNIDISKWDVSNVKNMSGMFQHCYNFNSDLSKWDVSKAKDMSLMFDGCAKFKSDLSNWDVSKVEDMRWMFDGCRRMTKRPEWWYEQR